jgi:hypothetical protein
MHIIITIVGMDESYFTGYKKGFPTWTFDPCSKSIKTYAWWHNAIKQVKRIKEQTGRKTDTITAIGLMARQEKRRAEK